MSQVGLTTPADTEIIHFIFFIYFYYIEHLISSLHCFYMLQNHLKFSSSDFSLPRICKFPGIAKFGVYKYPALLLLLFKKKMHKFFSLCKILIHCIFSFVDTGFTVLFLILKLEISLVVICNLHLLHLKLQSLMCSIFIK